MLGVIISLGSETVIEVKIWPVLLVCGLYLLIFYVYRYYHRYKNTKSFKKEKSEYEMTFKEMVESELSETNIKEVKDYTKIFAKRMHKMNKKLEKKGNQL